MIASRFGPFAGGTPGGGGMVASYAPVAQAAGCERRAVAGEGEAGRALRPCDVVWAQGFGGERKQREDLPVLAARPSILPAAPSASTAWSHPNLRLGAFAGGAGAGSTSIATCRRSRATTPSAASTAASTGCARSSISRCRSGRSRNESERRINNDLLPDGIELAQASYDGRFVSPEVAYGWRIPLRRIAGGAVRAQTCGAWCPSAKVRYLAAWYDGYTESGTTAPLTVNDRSLQIVRRSPAARAHQRGAAAVGQRAARRHPGWVDLLGESLRIVAVMNWSP